MKQQEIRMKLVIQIIISISICLLFPLSFIFAEDVSEVNVKKQVHQLMIEHKNKPSFSLTGKVEAGKNEVYSINGVDFSLAENALISGEFGIGKMAKVRGDIINSRKVAKDILVSNESYHPLNESNEAPL